MERLHPKGKDQLLYHCPKPQPLRVAVTALASLPEAVAPLSPADREIQTDTPKTAKRSPARYLWAALIARIYDDFPLLCLHCGGEMRLIGFVNEGAKIKKILDYIGEPSTPPQISPDVQFDQSVNW